VERRGLHHIGEVAEIVGLSLRTIRHYEEVGVVPPTGRTDGGFRLYSDDDIERLQLVKQLKPLQFSLEELRDIVATRDAVALEGPGREVERERLDMFAAVADQRCEQLRDQLVAAEEAARLLRHVASDRRSPTIPE
jgi:MerR family transcriptional regulator, copper efflux regulator